MIRVASTPPVWVSRLRDLTRLAVTALVLTVGLGGLFAAAGGPAAAARPPVVTSRVATLPADTRPGDDGLVDTRAGHERLTEEHSRPLPAGSAHEPTVRPAARVDVATPDPARDATGRRGPPRG